MMKIFMLLIVATGAILLSSCIGHEGGYSENGEETNYSWSKGLGSIFLEKHVYDKK